MRIIIILFVLAWAVVGQYQPLECFRTQRVVIWSGNELPKSYQVGGYNTTVAWTKSMSNISQFFLSYIGFKLHAVVNNFLSFHSSLSVSPTQGIININPHNSRILYLNFVVTLITATCFNQIQVIKAQYNCRMFNQSVRSTNLFSNLSEEQAMFNSTKFVFTQPSAYIVRPFLSALQVASINSNKAQVIFVNFIQSERNKSNFSLGIRSLNIEKNIIESISISILIISKKSFNPSIAFYLGDTTIANGTSDFQVNLGIPDHFYSMGFEDKCVLGLVRIRHQMSQPSAHFDIIKMGRNITGLTLEGIEGAILYVVCMIQCQPGYFNAFNGTPTICYPYPPFVTNCLFYDDQNRCIQCKTDYTLTSPYSCSQCNGVGQLTVGGCSSTVGCTMVQKVGTSMLQTICVACAQPDFYLNDFEVCQCYKGKIVTSNCINNQGCVATKKVGDLVICTACNMTGKFTLNGRYCECSDGYQLGDMQVCVTVCGDGKVVDKEECDDGNGQGGDGCGRCVVETDYKCSGGTVFSPSHCRYVGRQLAITFLYADKTPDVNQGVFTFSVSPAIALLSKMNLTRFFTFSSPALHSPPVWVLDGGLLQLQVDYFEDLEGTDAEFAFSFDTDFILHNSFTKTVTVRSRGSKLIVVRGLSNLKTMGEIVGYLSLAALFTVVMATLARRMMGAELLQLFQLLYFVHLTAADYTELYAKFKSFAPLSGNLYFFANSLSSFKTGETMNKLIHDAANTEHTAIALFSALLGLGAIILLTAAVKHFRPRFTFLTKVRTVVQDNAVTTLLVGSWLPVTMVACTLSQSQLLGVWIPKNGTVFMVTALCSAISLFVFREWRSVLESKRGGIAPKYFVHSYAPVFIGVLFVQIGLIAVAAMDFQIYLRECVGFTALAMVVWQLRNSPYHKIVHNVGIFFNQLTIALFCLWSILRDRFPALCEEQNETLFIILVFALLFLSLLITGIRTILVFRENCEQSSIFPVKQIKAVTKLKKLTHFNADLDSYLKESMIATNPYTLQRIKKTEIIKDWKEENQKRDEVQAAQIFNRKDMENRFKHIKKSLVRARQKGENGRDYQFDMFH